MIVVIENHVVALWCTWHGGGDPRVCDRIGGRIRPLRTDQLALLILTFAAGPPGRRLGQYWVEPSGQADKKIF